LIGIKLSNHISVFVVLCFVLFYVTVTHGNIYLELYARLCHLKPGTTGVLFGFFAGDATQAILKVIA
jgi:hypothetical protein